MLACPACGTASISATTREHMGVIKRSPCPHCGALLRLNWGRVLIAAHLLILSIAGLAGHIAWPRDRHLVQSLGSSLLVVMFIVLAAILRRRSNAYSSVSPIDLKACLRSYFATSLPRRVPATTEKG